MLRANCMEPTSSEHVPPAEHAPHHERVRGADGREYWKLTCFCGKSLLAPADGPHKHGRCPQCGKRLLFPTPERHITTGPLPVIPDRPPSSEQPRTQRHSSRRTHGHRSGLHRGTPVRRVPAAKPPHAQPINSDRVKPGQSASENAADKLRPDSTRARRTVSGMISAWPVAGRATRALAAFVDLTFALSLTAGMLLATPLLPNYFASTTFRVAFGLIVLWLNEGLLQWLWDGSIGKKLCVIVIRDEDGLAPNAENALLRPFVKLALIFAWPFALFDPSGRALHDQLLGTVVMKGRVQR